MDVIEILEELTGKKANVEFIGEPRGEPRHTWADISKALKILQYKPAVPLKEGLLREINDLKIIYKEEEY